MHLFELTGISVREVIKCAACFYADSLIGISNLEEHEVVTLLWIQKMLSIIVSCLHLFHAFADSEFEGNFRPYNDPLFVTTISW